MARIKFTNRKIAWLIKKGFGTGHGADYKPWLRVVQTPTRGRAHRPWSFKTNREHQLLSDVERDIFYTAEWSLDVLDIREQYPLRREVTQQIALELNIKHPQYFDTKVDTVMTVDFMLTLAATDESGQPTYMAINAKRDEESEDEVSLGKLEIQRTYFERLNIPHHLIYHSQLPRQQIRNIAFLRDALLKPDEVEEWPGYFASQMPRMVREIASLSPKKSTWGLADFCLDFDSRFELETGTGLRLARMLMHQRCLLGDISSKDICDEPMHTFHLSGIAPKVYAGGAR